MLKTVNSHLDACFTLGPVQVFNGCEMFCLCVTDKESVQQFETRIKNERKQQNDKVKISFTCSGTKSFATTGLTFSLLFLLNYFRHIYKNY